MLRRMKSKIHERMKKDHKSLMRFIIFCDGKIYSLETARAACFLYTAYFVAVQV